MEMHLTLDLWPVLLLLLLQLLLLLLPVLHLAFARLEIRFGVAGWGVGSTF